MKENGSSGKSAGKMTAHALDWWRESTAGRLVAPVTCALYEVFFLTRYVSTLPDGAVSMSLPPKSRLKPLMSW